MCVCFSWTLAWGRRPAAFGDGHKASGGLCYRVVWDDWLSAQRLGNTGLASHFHAQILKSQCKEKEKDQKQTKRKYLILGRRTF